MGSYRDSCSTRETYSKYYTNSRWMAMPFPNSQSHLQHHYSIVFFLKIKPRLTNQLRLLQAPCVCPLCHHHSHRRPGSQSGTLPRRGFCQCCLEWAWCLWPAGPQSPSGWNDPPRWWGWWPGPSDRSALHKRREGFRLSWGFRWVGTQKHQSFL